MPQQQRGRSSSGHHQGPKRPRRLERPEVPVRRTSQPLVHSELSFLNNSPFQMNPKLRSFKIPKLRSEAYV
ncbi:hypothetical protein CHUAL_005925 [Chamberlinius hualienensis]